MDEYSFILTLFSLILCESPSFNSYLRVKWLRKH